MPEGTELCWVTDWKTLLTAPHESRRPLLPGRASMLPEREVRRVFNPELEKQFGLNTLAMQCHFCCFKMAANKTISLYLHSYTTSFKKCLCCSLLFLFYWDDIAPYISLEYIYLRMTLDTWFSCLSGFHAWSTRPIPNYYTFLVSSSYWTETTCLQSSLGRFQKQTAPWTRHFNYPLAQESSASVRYQWQ